VINPLNSQKDGIFGKKWNNVINPLNSQKDGIF
jgi:hypothetical protein